MGAAPIPEGEATRLSALNSYNILDTLPEAEFDEIVKLASSICDVPIALISLVDGERQWFKARIGLDAPETHRNLAFCAHAILDPNETLIVEDATKEDRFSNNPLVTGETDIRFYAGQPLLTPEGEALGTLCVFDTNPRSLAPEQLAALQTLSRHVVHLLKKRKVEAELRLERERLKLAEASAKIGHWELDVDTKRAVWSDQVFALHGITREEFDPSLDSAIEFYHPEDRHIVENAVNQLIESLTPYEFEARLIQRSGNQIYVRSTGQPRMDERGVLSSIFGVIQDVSDTAEAVQKLQHANKFQDLVLDSIPDAVFVRDVNSKLIKGNRALYEKFPFVAHQHLMGTDGKNFMSSEVYDAIIAKDKEAFETGYTDAIGTFPVEGKDCWHFSTKRVRFEDENGTPFLLSIARDITERLKTENAVADAKAFQDLILDNIPDLVFVKDEEFRILSANTAFLNVYPAEMRDKVIGYTTVEEYEQKEADAFLAKDREAFERGYSETLEKIEFPDGEIRTLFTKKIRFENQSGNRFILGLATNVTERENLIERLVASNEELERFAYVCSHDLQEPLRMIRSFSSRLEEHLGEKLDGDELGQKYFHFVTDGAKRAQALISDVLTYSSLSSDTLSCDEINTAELVELIAASIRENSQDRAVDIKLEELPSISGNKTQIYQLFQNLMNNAVKFQPRGSLPVVQIGALKQGEIYQFYIKDNGIGIDPRHQRKIFDVFKRLHRRDHYPGTGVGLSICKKIVERHGGNIWVESEKGEGATFYFTLLKRMSSGAPS